jgi:TPR repeat protein
MARIGRIAGLAGLVGAALLAGCATTPEARFATLGPLRAALSTSPETLRQQADRNDANAQMALSLLYQYGQGGVAKDPVQAILLRQRATAQRGSTPITTYIAGLNGKPGRVSMIFVPRYDVSPGQAGVNAACANAIASGDRSAKGVEPCGGEERYDQLAAVWRR